MKNPYDPIDQTGMVIDGLDIGKVVSEIQKKGYCIVEKFLASNQVEQSKQILMKQYLSQRCAPLEQKRGELGEPIIC